MSKQTFTFVSDGEKSDYTLSFTPYPQHYVEIWLDGIALKESFRTISMANGLRVIFQNPPKNHVVIFIHVRTRAHRLTLFRDGEVLSARDLNQEINHIYHILQEMLKKEQCFARFSPLIVNDIHTELPPPRSQQIIGGDASGTKLINQPLFPAQELQKAIDKATKLHRVFTRYIDDNAQREQSYVDTKLQHTQHDLRNIFQQHIDRLQPPDAPSLSQAQSTIAKQASTITKHDVNLTLLDKSVKQLSGNYRRLLQRTNDADVDMPQAMTRIARLESRLSHTMQLYDRVQTLLPQVNASKVLYQVRRQISTTVFWHKTISKTWLELYHQANTVEQILKETDERLKTTYKNPPTWLQNLPRTITIAESTLSTIQEKLDARIATHRHIRDQITVMNQESRKHHAHYGKLINRFQQRHAQMDQTYNNFHRKLISFNAKHDQLPPTLRFIRDSRTDIANTFKQLSQKVDQHRDIAAQITTMKNHIATIGDGLKKQATAIEDSMNALQEKNRSASSRSSQLRRSSARATPATQRQAGDVTLASTAEVSAILQQTDSQALATPNNTPDKVLTLAMLQPILDACRPKAYHSSWLNRWSSGQPITVHHGLGRTPDHIQILAKLTKDISLTRYYQNKGLRKGMIFDLSASNAGHALPQRSSQRVRNPTHDRFFSVEITTEKIILHMLTAWPIVRDGDFFGLTGNASRLSQEEVDHNIRQGKPDVEAAIRVNAWVFPDVAAD